MLYSLLILIIIVTDDVDERDSDDMQIDPEKEAYYINDPKKALKTFFDREGLENFTFVVNNIVKYLFNRIGLRV